MPWDIRNGGIQYDPWGFQQGQMMGNADWSKPFHLFRSTNHFRLSWATRITLLRILLLVPFVSCMLHINAPEYSARTRTLLRYAAIGFFALMAVGDAVDGYLARRHRQVTRLGTFLDPVADKLLIVSSCLLLVSQRGHVGRFLLPPTVVVLIIGKDLFLVIGFVIVYLITARIYVAPAVLGKIATVMQLVMVGCVLVAPEVSSVIPHYASWLSVMWWCAAGVAILATLVYIWAGSRYIERYERAHAKQASASSD